MYSNKFAAKLVNIRQLCKKDMEKLSIFMVLSTYYPTFRIISIIKLWKSMIIVDLLPVLTINQCIAVNTVTIDILHDHTFSSLPCLAFLCKRKVFFFPGLCMS